MNIDHLNSFEQSYFEEMKKLIDQGNLSLVNNLFADDYKFTLVTPKEFLEDPIYTGDYGAQMYPKLKEDFGRIFTTYGIMEVILGGSQRWGKNYLAEACAVRMTYEILALKKPQEFFGISSSTDIYIAVFSVNATKAKSEFFDGVKRIFDNSPFFNTYRIRKDLETRVIFKLGSADELARGNLIFLSGNSTELSAFGQNTISGFLDEANFMPDIKNSKRSRGHGQQDNNYNAALTLYNSVFRRMKNTYGTIHGTLPGKFFTISSQKHEKDYINTRIEHIKATNDKSVIVLRYASWDTNPKFKNVPKFKIGINHKKTRTSSILYDNNENEYERVIQIPELFRKDFEDDFFGAMCDLAGETYYGNGKFINGLKVPLMFNKVLKPYINKNKVDFSLEDITIIKQYIQNINKPRFAHIDMAESRDYVGFVSGYLYGSTTITKQENNELIQVEMPIIAIDFLLTIVPPKYGKIDFDKVYELFLRLKNNGIYFQNVAYDRFQTTYLIQRLNKQGINTEYISMDRLPCEPYHDTQHAIHQERVYCVDNALVETELKGLEKDANGKIEHPSDGSKDLADGLGSVVHQVTKYFLSNYYGTEN